MSFFATVPLFSRYSKRTRAVRRATQHPRQEQIFRLFLDSFEQIITKHCLQFKEAVGFEVARRIFFCTSSHYSVDPIYRSHIIRPFGFPRPRMRSHNGTADLATRMELSYHGLVDFVVVRYWYEIVPTKDETPQAVGGMIFLVV